LKQRAEVIEAVGRRRPRLRVADIEGGLKEVKDRIKDQHRRHGGDPVSGQFLRGESPRG
jgi:hypothetical protein